ncbi:hypothetical protein AAG570_004074 [Ranatra chinensis]|uniref:Major facilitator superfamily (MFS) profile domain-containing protein n=1 Tax=Ranatra chinensis TaxID=642074 RepID=A0ABD0Y2S8_9HEMI
MASKRRNMFQKNKTQETTENGSCNLPPFCDWLVGLLSLSVPRGEDGSYDKCRMYVADWSQVLARNMTEADPKWPTAGCNKWQYQFDDIPYPTIATELDWVCDDAALPSAAQSVFFLGAIAGGLIFGWLADRYGRIPALVGANVVGLVGGIMTAWSYSFWFFTLSRFVVGLAFDNCFTMMYILVPEDTTWTPSSAVLNVTVVSACDYHAEGPGFDSLRF